MLQPQDALIESTHEIMALIALRKLNLQTRMRSHPVGLDVWFSVGPFVYFHTSCVRTAKPQARCAVSPEPSLFAYAISTIISWAGSVMSSITQRTETIKICDQFTTEKARKNISLYDFISKHHLPLQSPLVKLISWFSNWPPIKIWSGLKKRKHELL